MSRPSFRAFVLCGVLGLGVAGSLTASASDLQAEQPQQGLRVTYLLYSGRPNPSVLVTDPAQVRAIEEQLARSLADGQRTAVTESPAVLGYTGIQIERLGDAGRGSPPMVLRGAVLREKANPDQATLAPAQATVSRDAEVLEDLLLGLGRDQQVIGDVELSVIRATK
ncbi:hypothetical protein COCOR_01477 [Corallococcus coralloides DSM 2259]|uniref:Lipoprotein n=1 Tax=Corallococcus coralloides (strain ATCC 25202 / DSM 2259 / NBRC 100086 / M2) TaxID=1144275 RepID=H8MVC7_CORCM|nr:hypothetical protein [Corallococcus coralloides]AFE04089.1 hypothetical protein COCOR_01477 [Corallococcus coralloides DSM 2259]